jgi:hypothetical protein
MLTHKLQAYWIIWSGYVIYFKKPYCILIFYLFIITEYYSNFTQFLVKLKVLGKNLNNNLNLSLQEIQYD